MRGDRAAVCRKQGAVCKLMGVFWGEGESTTGVFHTKISKHLFIESAK